MEKETIITKGCKLLLDDNNNNNGDKYMNVGTLILMLLNT
jgi:hypothetical protein